MIRIFTRQIEKLGTEEGQSLVFVALVGLVLFLVFSMSMNIGELINAKIKSQNAADAVAISAATWEARALNLIAGSNLILLEYWDYMLIILTGLLGSIALCVGLGTTDPVLGQACALIALLVGSFFFFTVGEGLKQVSMFQESVVDFIDSNVVAGEEELNAVARANYYYKENTADDTVGTLAYVYQAADGNILVDRNGMGGVLERAGMCEVMLGVEYLLYREGDVSQGAWDQALLYMENLYQLGKCSGAYVKLDFRKIMPYMLKSKRGEARQDFEQFLPVTVGVYKERKPPVVLGKGNTAEDCVSGEGDTKFPCPTLRRYAFSSGHAFSESVWRFYNEDTHPGSTPYPIPMIIWKMDWEARLFAIEPDPLHPAPFGGKHAYDVIIGQVEPLFGADEKDALMANVLRRFNTAFFLY